ncbi:hypothetical protein D7X33_00920 [Butyricicoccus sp. 1XD8-22]|nr:hypothetical protein D7X33_00920 [Butyricicoccus sp. 1XD8-22]
MTIAERLAGYAAEFSIDEMPSRAVEAARAHFADTVGCILAGASSDTAAKAAAYAGNSNGGHPESSVLGTGGMRCKAAFAALANAAAAHCRDYDDMSISLNGHASAVLVPVALAMGERHHISGKGVLEAYMLGAEIDALLGKLLTGSTYSKAWNTTCTIGAAGAAAAACKLMGASEEEYVHAMGLAASSSGCVKENYGTAAKDISVGLTAFLGIFSAEMAGCGISANPRIFEGVNGVFAAAGVQSPHDIVRILEQHTSDFLEPGMVLKPYPTCRGNHNALDCFQQLVQTHALRPSDIEKVVCKVQQTALDTDKYPWPQTREQAKFSIRYCLGRMIYAGRLSSADFAGSGALDPYAVEFMGKIDVLPGDGFAEARFGAKVEIQTANGKRLTARSSFAAGDPMNPMCNSVLESKIRDCLSVKYEAEKSGQVLAALRDLCMLQDICELTEQLA